MSIELQKPTSMSAQDQAKAEALQYGTDGMVKMIEVILDDLKAGEVLKEAGMSELWIPTMKSTKLSFLDDTDVAILSEQFESSVCSLLLNRRRGKFTMTDNINLDMLRMLFRINIKRSVGTTDSKINERIAQLTTITHQTGKWKEESGSSGGNPLARLIGRRK